MTRTALCVLALSLVSCGPPTSTAVEPPHVLWEADAQTLNNPFPDTRLLVDGNAKLRADWYKPFIHPKAINGKMRDFFAAYTKAAAVEIHGFGNVGPVLLRTSVAVDPATLSGKFARLVKKDQGFVVLEKDVAVEHSAELLKSVGKTPDADFPEFMLVRPGMPMPESSEGVLVMLKGVKTLSGELLGRGAAWDKDTGKPDVKAIATALGVAEADVLFAIPQKSTAVTPVLKSLAAWVDGPTGLPTVTIPPKGTVPEGNVTRPVGTWEGADVASFDPWLHKFGFSKPDNSVAKVIIGELTVKDLRDDQGVWKADWVADPSKAKVVQLPFILTIPNGVKPAAGWQTIIVGHGIGGRNVPRSGDNNSLCLELAQLLAGHGLACLAIDATSHGTRGPFTDFFVVDNVPAIRERFREMTFDLLQLSRAAPTIDLDGDPNTVDINPDLGYFGNSLGAIMGSGFVSVATRVKYSVLNVPGGGLANVLTSLGVRDLIGLLLVTKTGLTFDSVEYYSAFPIFRAAAQPFMEAGDPINVALALPADRAVLMQEGINDQTIPNLTTEWLSKAMSLTVPTAPITGTGPVRSLMRIDAASFLSPEKAAIYNGHNVFYDFAPPRNSAMRFLETRGKELILE